MAYSEDVNINLNVLAGAMGGITAIMGGMSALTSTFGQFGTEAANAFGTADALLVGTTVLLTSFGVQAAEAFGEFEQGMKIVQTVSNQSGAAIQELSDKANEMSVAYRTAIGDITDGLQTLGRAGLNSASAQLEVLESGLQTAKLEGRNLNSVLEEIIQNTAMLGGDLKSIDFGAQSEYLNSRLVATSMTAPITSHDISQTLQYAGGTAAAAGANLESTEGKKKLDDLLGTIAAFAQKGVTGSMAGTALRAFFTKPASQDKQVTAGLERIGLTADDLWENGGESMKSVSDQIGIIQRQMDHRHLSQMDKIEVWSKIVGAKMGQQMMKLDSSTIKDLTRDIEGANSAEELAAQTLQTYTQKLSQMQQQGDLAFRELGSKVVMFLTPIVDLITMIFGALSNPVVNTGVFIAAGALISHGIQKIWGMITAVVGEVRGLLGQVVQGIESVNTLAGGSVSGFNQSAASVEMLNTRLAQTNNELMMMQAQFMKITGVTKTGTYVPPLGLVDKNGKLPANMIGTADQSVLWRPGTNVDGKSYHGKFYDPSHEAAFRSDFKKQLLAENEAKINKAVEGQKFTDSRGQTHYRLPGQTTFASKDQVTAHFQEKMGLTPKEIQAKTDAVLKSGKTSVHSSLMSMTEDEYKKLEKSWSAAEKRLSNVNNYINKETGKFDTKKYQSDQLKAYNKAYNAQMDPRLANSTVNGVNFRRALLLQAKDQRFFGDERVLQKQAQLEQYEKTRARQINPQQQSYSDKARELTTKRLNAYNNAISKVTGATDRLSMKWNKWRAGDQWATQGSKAMAQFEARAIAAMEKIEVGTTSFNEGLQQLQRASGLSAAEFEKLWLSSDSLSKKFLELYGITMADAEVTEEDIIAKEADAKATIHDMVTKEEDAAANAGGAMSKFGNAVSTVTGYLGGPLMAAMMAFTVATQAYQSMVSSWQETVQEASTRMSEATDKLNTAKEKVGEIYKTEYNDLTAADEAKLIDYQIAAIQGAYNEDLSKHGKKTPAKFSDMYDNEVVEVKVMEWSDEEKDSNYVKTAQDLEALNETAETLTLTDEEHIKQLEDNTAALNSATYAFSQALAKEAGAFNDPMFGYKGIQTKMEKNSMFDGVMAWLANGPGDIFGAWLQGNMNKEGFYDLNSPVLTKYQKSKDFAGSTEFAPAMMLQISESGVEGGLQQFFGNDFDETLGLINTINRRHGQEVNYFQSLSNNGFQGMDSKSVSMAQMLWKEDTESVQVLAKNMFRYEQERGLKSGHSAMEDWRDGTLKQRIPGKDSHKSADGRQYYKALEKEKWTVQDKNLNASLQKLYKMTDGKLSYANILAMGQMQMMSDMYNVANELIYPSLSQTMLAAQQNVLATGVAGTNAGSASQGAGAAANNAAVIAGLLGEKFKQDVGGLEYENDYLSDPNGPTEKFLGIFDTGKALSKEDFLKGYNDVNNHDFDKYRYNAALTIAQSGDRLNHPDWTQDQLAKNAQTRVGTLMNPDGTLKDGTYPKWSTIQDTLLTPVTDYLEGAIPSVYDQSKVGEYGGGDTSKGSGTGGGDGDGSDKGSDKSGSKKERVDLVLCNKKEIPKLNVNLFKKPPSFTVLNKNFRVRDIKISSQDKPKAIMNAVKNGIIETQKRMDPKIIQDEESVYDPVAASDGTSTTPSGTTKTTT